jgi:hypothetical protein
MRDARNNARRSAGYLIKDGFHLPSPTFGDQLSLKAAANAISGQDGSSQRVDGRISSAIRGYSGIRVLNTQDLLPFATKEYLEVDENCIKVEAEVGIGPSANNAIFRRG